MKVHHNSILFISKYFNRRFDIFKIKQKGIITNCILTTTYIFFFFISTNSLYAQEIGSWNILNVKYKYNEKWSFFGEGQIRSLKFYNHFHYMEYKVGADYNAYKNVKLSLGIGNYQTYKEDGNFVLPKNNDEYRIWPQVSLYQSIGKIKIEQRYRLELRFTSNGYRNRFRYRVGASYSFGKEQNEYKPFQVNLSNEVFFSENEPFFERNRILLAANYKPSKPITLHLGYLHQFDYKINNETGKDFLVVGFYYEFFRKPKSKQETTINNED